MKKIKVGTKLISCYNLMMGSKFHLTNLKEYEVKSVHESNCTFTVIDDQSEECIFNFSDVPDAWFKFKKNKKDPIVKQVTDKFKARSKVGIEKYGTTLEENNTDDFLEHLQQELMDATLYIEKLKSKDKTLLTKYNELISKIEKLQKKDVSSYATSELIKELIKRNYSVIG